MEKNNILTANILDILFEGRNKKYGAYDLRITYNKRIITALGITSAALMLFISAVLRKSTDETKNIRTPEVIISTSPIDIEEKALPVKTLIKARPVKSLAYTAPVIIKYKHITETSEEVAKLFDSQIDTRNVTAESDNSINLPVDIKGSLIAEEPPKKIKKDETYIPIEIEALFNGDWGAYVKKEIERNIEELTEAGESGTCMVKFMVSIEGDVSNVEAITMRGTRLAEVAVDAIKKGPGWIPAMQNGRKVISYRIQPITFKINN